MTGGFGLRKQRCQWDGMIEIRIAASPQVLLCLCCIAIIQRELTEMIIDLAQPCWMGRFVCVLKTPSEFLLRGLSLVKVAWKLRMYHTGDPVHDENLSA